MKLCCATCRFWLEGVSPTDGFGWCSHPALEAKKTTSALKDLIEGEFTLGKTGLETEAGAFCEGHEPTPVKYRKPS